MALTQEGVKFSDFVRGLPSASEADLATGNNMPIVSASEIKKMGGENVAKDVKLQPFGMFEKVENLHYEYTTFVNGQGVVPSADRISSGLIPVEVGDIFECLPTKKWYNIHLISTDGLTEIGTASTANRYEVTNSNAGFVFILYRHTYGGRGLDTIVKKIGVDGKRISFEDLDSSLSSSIDGSGRTEKTIEELAKNKDSLIASSGNKVPVDSLYGYATLTMQRKTIDINTGEMVDSTARNASDYLDVDEWDILELSSTTTSYWLRCFDGNKQNLFTPSMYSSVVSTKKVYLKELKSLYAPGKLKFVVLVSINTSAVTHTIFATKNTERKMIPLHADSQGVISMYNLVDDDGHYTSSRLMLPSNYTADGKKVPLIVFCPGSADYMTMKSKMTDNYNTYYKYLCDEGFAVMSAYGWGNFIQEISQNTAACGTWNTPINQKCWNSAIKFILDNFNVDEKNIFVSAKSLGGIQALPYAWSDVFNIKAVGLLASAISPVELCFGYKQGVNTRKIYAKEMEFSEDTNNVLDLDSYKSNQDFKNYVLENYEKWAKIDPFAKCAWGVSKEDFIQGSCFPQYIATNENWHKLCARTPIKMWVADDDYPIESHSKAIRNAMIRCGCNVEFRSMGSGTGGHHAVDYSDLAPQTTNFETRLGIHYDTIPTAYYELAQFFKLYEV